HYPDLRFLEIARDTGCCAILGIDAHNSQMITDSITIHQGEKLAEKFGLPLVETLPGLGRKI
ncbi:MAG: histidinol phosphate phosphatase, partial [Ruminococcus sp.]|nr:histidinol phosphate phosphatase [Ruminococcus sp.]